MSDEEETNEVENQEEEDVVSERVQNL